MRVYPHQQDTGGFFIAVLEKRHQAPWENERRCSMNQRLLPWESQADWQKKKQEKKQREWTEEKDNTKMDSGDQGKVKAEGNTKGTAAFQVDTTCVGDQVIHEEMDCRADAVSNDETGDNLNEHETENMNVDSDENEEDSAELVGGDEADKITEQSTSGLEKESAAQNTANTGDAEEGVQPPRKKAKVEMKGFKEDPFVFLKDDDEHWPLIKEFYGIDESFPASQLLVRSVGGKKRNVYLVSKAVKDVMEMVDDNHKVVNTGMKVIARAEADNVDCFFRLMQEGIEALLPFINKRKVFVTQEDVMILLTQDRPFCTEFSSTTRQQFDNIEGQGCIVYVYEPNGPYSKPSDTIGCKVTFCGWKAKVSTRVQISKFDKAHYQVLCGIPPAEKRGKKTPREQEDESSVKTDGGFKEDAVDKPSEDEEQTGFIGDILNLEAPEGSLDVGFI